jgi:hypothetical protein
MNWTGHVTAASRSNLDALLKREELERTGIYILIGDNPEDSSKPMVYIGEGDEIGVRLKAHAKREDQNGKDFWNRAIVLTSKDANLTKAHARYLESRLIAVAARAGRAKIVNGTYPDPIRLPEADISDMEFFVSQAEIILPLLGVNILRSTKVDVKQTALDTAKVAPESSSPVFEIRSKKFNILACAQEIDGEFVVLADSRARTGWTGVEHGYSRLKEQLETSGTIEATRDGKTSVFTENQVFSSPSAAAAVISGQSANGRIAWKVAGSGMTYGDWQDKKVEKLVS